LEPDRLQYEGQQPAEPLILMAAWFVPHPQTHASMSLKAVEWQFKASDEQTHLLPSGV